MCVGSQEAKAVHALPEHNTGAGVRLNVLHHSTETLGDRDPPPSHRATGQSLVPEQENEEQETEREIQADDAVGRVFAQSSDQGGTPFSGATVHDFP